MNNWFSYNLKINVTEGNFVHQNIANIHDQYATGMITIPISPEWANITLSAEAELISNNRSSFLSSPSLLIDYRSLLGGISCSYSILALKKFL